jgi:hypothetical protein
MIRRLIRAMSTINSTSESVTINQLTQKIKLLELKLASLPSSSSASPTAEGSIAGDSSTSGYTKKIRRLKTAASSLLGPLPPILANAPKRHVAFLFSCKLVLRSFPLR